MTAYNLATIGACPKNIAQSTLQAPFHPKRLPALN